MLGMKYTKVIQIKESILVKHKGKEVSHLHFGKSTQYSLSLLPFSVQQSRKF